MSPPGRRLHRAHCAGTQAASARCLCRFHFSTREVSRRKTHRYQVVECIEGSSGGRVAGVRYLRRSRLAAQGLDALLYSPEEDAHRFLLQRRCSALIGDTSAQALDFGVFALDLEPSSRVEGR